MPLSSACDMIRSASRIVGVEFGFGHVWLRSLRSSCVADCKELFAMRVDETDAHMGTIARVHEHEKKKGEKHRRIVVIIIYVNCSDFRAEN